MAIDLLSLPESCQAAVKDALKESSSIMQLNCLETNLRSVILDELERMSRDDLNLNMEEHDASSKRSSLKDLFEACLQVFQYLQQEDKGIDGLAKLALILLEDIAEGAPLPSLERFYNSCKPFKKLCNTTLWKTTSGMGHTLQFIRVCNQLLRRLPPKSEWSGRILLELAHRLPLTDKSSLKPWGSVSCTVPLDLDGDDGDSNYNFYQTFWSLQQDFSNPYQIASFGTFVSKYQQVLTQLETCACNIPKDNVKKKREPTVEGLSTESLQYLTSRRLLSAQLESCRDLPLHILTQFSITQAFLSTQSPQLASALEPLAKRNELLMQKLAPRHSQMLKTLLQDREVLWRDWKKNKCQPALQSPAMLEEDGRTRDKVNLVTLSAADKEENNSDDLDFLQPISDLCNVSQLMLAAVPSIENHLSSYVEALDPDAGIEEEYSPKRDQVMSWQALRLLSQQHLPLFSHITSRGDFENVVRHMYKRRGKDIPGEFLMEVVDSEEESDREEDEILVDETDQISGNDAVTEDHKESKTEDKDEKNEGSKISEGNQNQAKEKKEDSVIKDDTANYSTNPSDMSGASSPGAKGKEFNNQSEDCENGEEGEEVEDNVSSKQSSEAKNEDREKMKIEEERNKRFERAPRPDSDNNQDGNTKRKQAENNSQDLITAVKQHKEESSRDSNYSKRSNSVERNRQDSRRGSRSNPEVEERRGSDRPSKRPRTDDSTRGRGGGRGMGGSRGRGPGNSGGRGGAMSGGRGGGHPPQQDSRNSWDDRRGAYDRRDDRRSDVPNNDRRDDRRAGHGSRDGGGRRPHRDYSRRR
mmetsp:Transcript_8335/g.12835  ORF Transcript_8335/g.12835 Transcript_8335/m.12835 type:complete len:812 (-) Transcript_8335:108-2543(-)